ncbi:hypothetical protein E3C22_03360 [Jiella endophytica]|uniref:Uncharacterized protein n=1 Tax=Jiella endophytica TaxID=2558362 RepID=A0A4Y8RUA6_9HYPH|nr:hypothetical protein [Jiella endophytica]TFF27508.1 hypothetical protein E3C22_03360 [Jiella endophytica]
MTIGKPRGRDHHFYKHGLFTGMSSFRYSSETQVTLPGSRKTKPIISGSRRQSLVDRLFDGMTGFHLTPFENEGPARHGVRSALCMDGHGWRQADREAKEIVDEALKRFGVPRPTWEEGQPDYADGAEYCAWCRGPMDDAGRSKRSRFCSVECAKSALLHRDAKSDAYVGTVLRQAYRMVLRAKTPPRPCEYCGKPFHGEHAGSRFCSPKCVAARVRLPEITCQQCGKTCRPLRREQTYCSLACKQHARWQKTRESLAHIVRQCDLCGENFTPRSDRSIYCSQRCMKRMQGRRYRLRKAAAMQPGEVIYLTPRLFDQMVCAKAA